MRERVECTFPECTFWTDGCENKDEGKRNFRMVADSLSELGIIIDHNFAATSHFKGTHSGIGGVPKNMMRRAQLNTDKPIRVHNAHAAYQFLEERMGRRSVKRVGSVLHELVPLQR